MSCCRTNNIKLRAKLFLSFFIALFPLILVAQNTSNKGKDFWLGYGNHVGNGSQRMVLYVTSDVNTTGKIEIPGLNYTSSFTVTANSITTVTVPQNAFLDGEGQYKRGIHVTADRAVVVYGHIYDSKVSGASLILPVTSLGKEYYSINYKQVSNQLNAYSYFFVVATEDNTEVEITPSANTKNGKKAGETFKVVLSKGEIYQVLGAQTGSENFGQGLGTNYMGEDLTGSVIKSVSTTNESCKRIAVFSGSGKIGIGCRPGAVGSSDNLFQQVYPTNSWGKKFVTVPLASRDYDVIRVVKSDPAAFVTVNGNTIPATSFTNNFYYDFKSQTVNVIESDKPIQVAQYAVTQGQGFNCDQFQEANGDPEMIFLNATEQNIDDITVYSTSAFDILIHFINVVIKTEAVASFKMDGVSRQQYFNVVPNNSEYSYAQIPVPNAGVHHLQADEGFNAIAYGFGAAESYGYSAGTNLKGMNVYIEERTSKKQVSSGCKGSDLRFRLDLVYPVSRLTWDFKNGSSPIVKTYTQADSTYISNGNTFYVYKLPQDVSFTEVKDYTIEVTTEKLNSDGCGNTEVIPIDFSVYSSPDPDFSAIAGCEGSETSFTDLSNSNGRELKTWLWDFGDGTTSNEQNPKHVFTQGKIYNVTLTVSNNTSCPPVPRTKQIKVFKKASVGFEVTGACIGDQFIFTDKTVSQDGGVKTWIWDLGDTVITRTSAAPFQYQYKTVGTYKVKLTIVTDNNCSSFAEKDVVVNPLPTADFVLPEVCIADAFAEFINASSIEDHSESGFTYHWNFGDPNATAQTPNTSTQKNGRHKYLSAGNYTVTLTVTSNKGCSQSITKTCTINGGQPNAEFALQQPGAQCSDKEVGFINSSSVNPGKITRIEWYYDLVKEPNVVEVDEDPYPGKVYTHKYPTFHSPATIPVKVRQIAYSGTVCNTVTEQTITLKGVPDIDFDLPAEICMEVPSFQVNASEQYGYSGNGTFSGNGITSTGLFKPTLAGEGTHTITYTFNTDNGCPVSLSKDITVIPTPVVNAGEDKTIIAFGATQLNAVTNEPVQSFKWTPSVGLSSDNIPNPIASPIKDVTYTVTVVTEKGCTSSDKVFIEVLGTPSIPNTFTPNGDQLNDVWEIKYLESLPRCSIKVFNRYGQTVFNSVGYANPWDGNFNGQPLPAGPYYYILDPGNGRKVLSGYVTILR